ncbi:hypothetical protein PGT21_009034 [Puccinia graminis f. sp. tritici]|uniref:Uncharacterized protein n=2 Tax=Puccinia graminis f. sp. tritici TaxID=56615 RepID=A0A5B0QFI0_PUCGR|nr:hypothetical protein PGT21_009034 [Puccinia graminis f. sp. tritici]
MFFRPDLLVHGALFVLTTELPARCSGAPMNSGPLALVKEAPKSQQIVAGPETEVAKFHRDLKSKLVNGNGQHEVEFSTPSMIVDNGDGTISEVSEKTQIGSRLINKSETSADGSKMSYKGNQSWTRKVTAKTTSIPGLLQNNRIALPERVLRALLPMSQESHNAPVGLLESSTPAAPLHQATAPHYSHQAPPLQSPAQPYGPPASREPLIEEVHDEEPASHTTSTVHDPHDHDSHQHPQDEHSESPNQSQAEPAHSAEDSHDHAEPPKQSQVQPPQQSQVQPPQQSQAQPPKQSPAESAYTVQDPDDEPQPPPRSQAQPPKESHAESAYSVHHPDDEAQPPKKYQVQPPQQNKVESTYTVQDPDDEAQPARQSQVQNRMPNPSNQGVNRSPAAPYDFSAKLGFAPKEIDFKQFRIIAERHMGLDPKTLDEFKASFHAKYKPAQLEDSFKIDQSSIVYHYLKWLNDKEKTWKISGQLEDGLNLRQGTQILYPKFDRMNLGEMLVYHHPEVTPRQEKHFVEFATKKINTDGQLLYQSVDHQSFGRLYQEWQESTKGWKFKMLNLYDKALGKARNFFKRFSQLFKRKKA